MHTVYVLYSQTGDKLYIGHTADLSKRLLSHNSLSKKGFTVRYRPWRLIHSEKHQSKKAAMIREKALKSGKGREKLF
jgi:putative endonuclease